MNNPVSFEIAKLLKEKGFNEECFCYYNRNHELEDYQYWECSRRNSDIDECNESGFYDLIKEIANAPTIAQAVMWLYETHSIWIYVDTLEFGSWRYKFKYNKPYLHYPSITQDGVWGFEDYDSPTEAYEAGIIYALNNLIQ